MKSVKDKYHMIALLCGIVKNDTKELIYKTEIANKLVVTKGEGGRRDKLGVWDEQIHTTLRKINKDLCIAQGTVFNIS